MDGDLERFFERDRDEAIAGERLTPPEASLGVAGEGSREEKLLPLVEIDLVDFDARFGLAVEIKFEDGGWIEGRAPQAADAARPGGVEDDVVAGGILIERPIGVTIEALLVVAGELLDGHSVGRAQKPVEKGIGGMGAEFALPGRGGREKGRADQGGESEA